MEKIKFLNSLTSSSVTTVLPETCQFISRYSLRTAYYNSNFITFFIDIAVAQHQVDMDQKKQLFLRNELYSKIIIPKTRINGVDYLSSNLFTAQQKAEIFKNYWIYKLQGGKSSMSGPKIPSMVKETKKPTLLQKVKNKVSNMCSKIHIFLKQHPGVCITFAIIIVVLFLGTAIYGFSSGVHNIDTTTDGKGDVNPTPDPDPQSPSDHGASINNLEEKNSSEDGSITDIKSEEGTGHPQPWDGIGDEIYAGKPVFCTDVDKSVIQYFTIAREKGTLPWILHKAIQRILELDDNFLAEHNVLEVFTNEELNVLFKETEFLALPAIRTTMERGEYCLNE